MARLYTGCQDIISLRNAYHGNAAGTMGATAQSCWKFNVVQWSPGFWEEYKISCCGVAKPLDTRTNEASQSLLFQSAIVFSKQRSLTATATAATTTTGGSSSISSFHGPSHCRLTLIL
ncbi:hypothetical protein ACFE04_018248 [Oxalis oulophora]